MTAASSAASVERERIVAYLRQEARKLHFVGGAIAGAAVGDAADAIERLEHLYGPPRRAIPLCDRCCHKSTSHVVDDEERRECMEWSCGCEQFDASPAADGAYR